ncbi:MAG: hypothetical protein GX751_06210 [Desulfuromonadaceae bacterium]|nr:hypothetical protein [Desulfuromonadaceae bacterium]
MNELRILQNLRDRARNDEAPPVDVTARVMARVRAQEVNGRELSILRPLEWLTAFSSAAAVAAGFLMVIGFQEWADPLIVFFLDIQ